MKRLPMAICLILVVIFASASFAQMTAEKAEFNARLESAIAANNSGLDLTVEQRQILKRTGHLNQNNELDHLGGPDDFGYAFSDSDEPDGPTYEWIDISETGTAIANWSDNVTLGPYDIGFDFPFYGETYNQAWLCSNGWIAFTADNGVSDWWEEGVPNPILPNCVVYWSWMDLYPGINDIAYYGNDGNGNAVFQFEFTSGDQVQAEVILSQDGSILIQYGPNHTNEIPRDGTRVGVENANGTVGLLASDAGIPANWPHSELAVAFEILEMGNISGVISDDGTGNPINDATVSLYQDEELVSSTETNNLGEYSLRVEAGDYDIVAEAFGYIDAEPTQVTVPVEDTEIVNIALVLGEAPEIDVNTENLTITVPWRGLGSDVINISNVGGLDLDFEIDPELMDEEELFAHRELRERVRRNFENTMPNHNVNNVVNGNSREFPYATPTEEKFCELDDPCFLLVQDANPWGYTSNQEILDMLEIPYDLINSTSLAEIELDGYTVIMTSGVQNMEFHSNLANNFDRIHDFIEQGGWFQFCGSLGSNWTLWDGTTVVGNFNNINRVIEPEHPMLVGIAEELHGNSANHGTITNYPEEALVLIVTDTNEPTLIEYELGRGHVIVTTETWEWSWQTLEGDDNTGEVLRRSIAYCAEFANSGWLSTEPEEGTIAPDGNMDVTVYADAAIGDLRPGNYEGVLNISSEFPGVETRTVWVTLVVEEPGRIVGDVTDLNTNAAIPNSEIRVWLNEIEYESYFSDNLGHYDFEIGEGTHTLTAIALDHYECDAVQVDVVDGQATTQNFALDPHIPPEIEIGIEAMNFETSWMSMDSDVLTITNSGGLDLNWKISVEYIENELAMANAEQTIARRLDSMPVLDSNPDWNLQYASQNWAIDPDFTPTFELDEGPYLVMANTNFENSIIAALNALEIEYTYINSDNYATVDLTEYGTLICGHDGGGTNDTDADAACEFMANGGTVMYFGGIPAMANGFTRNGVVGVNGTDWQECPAPHLNVVDNTSNLAEDLPEEYTFVNTRTCISYIRYQPSEDADVALTNGNDYPVLFAEEYGDGLFIAFANSPAFGYWEQEEDREIFIQIFNNMINYSGSGWLVFEERRGTIPPTRDQEIIVTADASQGELGPGTYEASVTIESDHHLTDPVTFWATLTVAEPGSITGEVVDEETNEPIPGAEIRVWYEENYESYYCNNGGIYLFPIGEGEYRLAAIAENYYGSEFVTVEVVEGVVTTQNFTLDHHIPPEIEVDPNNFLFEVPWMGNTSDQMSISNLGGLDLNFDIDVDYIEDEEMTDIQFRRRIGDIRRNMVHAPIATIITDNAVNSHNGRTPSETAPSYSELDDPYFLIFQDSDPWWEANTHIDVLVNNEIPYDMVGSDMMAEQDLDDYTVIMTPSCQSRDFYATFEENEERFAEYVEDGGWLEFHGCTQGVTWTLWDGTAYVSAGDGINRVVAPDHPIVAGIPEEFTGGSANHGYMNNVPEDALVIITDTQGRPVVIERSYGQGNMIVSTETWEFGANQNPHQGAGDVMINAILYSAENAKGGGWLAFEPSSGVIVPDALLTTDIFVDAAPPELNPGNYEAMITVSGDHPDTAPVTIFATLVVGDPGIIEGTVTDAADDQPLEGTEIIVWDENGEYLRSTFTDVNGQYSIFVGEGTWDVSAHIAEYYVSDLVQVFATVGEITVQNFAMNHHIPPTIDVSLTGEEEYLSFFSDKDQTDTEFIAITNNGGLDLEYNFGYEYTDDQEIARRLIETGSIYPEQPKRELDEDREITLPTKEELKNAPAATKRHYREVAKAVETMKTGGILTAETRNLLQGVVEPLNELDNAGGPDEFGYNFVDSDENNGFEYDWVDISETGVANTGWWSGNMRGPFPIDFDFPFYGEFYNEFYVSSYGFITFSPNQVNRDYWENPLPFANDMNNCIYAHWCYVNLNGNGTVYYGLDERGDFVIQYDFVADARFEVEIILRRDGTIVVQYGENHSHTGNWNGTYVAIENADGDVAMVANNDLNDRFPMAEKAVAFYLNDWHRSWLSSEDERGTIQIGETADIAITADSYSGDLEEGLYEGLINITASHRDTPPEVVWAQYIVGAGGIFHPVKPTGIPYPIIIDSATLNGAPAPEDFCIGVFDRDTCVGTLTSNGEWPRTMISWQSFEDPHADGFTIGNEMTFHVWAEGMDEPIIAQPNYIQGDGTFGMLPYTQVSLSAVEIPKLELELQRNYFELISSCVTLEDPDISEVVSSIYDYLAIVYKNDGSVYIPDEDPELEFDNIGDWDYTQGYRVFCYEPSVLELEGDLVDPDIQIEIEGGRWNWIGYPFNYEIPVVDALSSIEEHLEIIMNDDGLLYIPGIINTMEYLVPGEGYAIFTDADVDLIFNVPEVLVAGNAREDRNVENGNRDDSVIRTGKPFATIVSFSDDALALEPAIIEVFDGSIKVGSGIISADEEVSAVIAWEGDVKHNLSGFTSGNEMHFVVRSASGEKLPLVIDGEAPAFGKGAYAKISMKMHELPTEFVVEHGYPNPFNPTITVPFATPSKGNVNFTVFNVLGQEVFHSSRTFEAGFHRFLFDANQSGKELVSGMYFLKVDFEGKANTQKLMLLK